MGDNNGYLCCNIEKCRVLLTEKIWVTRCLHIFCPDHGHSYFTNKSSQLCCPVCNEVIVRDHDLEFCDTCPNDMILAGLSPEKAVSLAARSVKLWRHQTEAENNFNISRLNNLSRKYGTNKHLYEKSINKMKIKYEAEIAGLKAFYDEIGDKLRNVSEELEETKRSLKKYKLAYNNMRSSRLADNNFHRHTSTLNYRDHSFHSPSEASEGYI